MRVKATEAMYRNMYHCHMVGLDGTEKDTQVVKMVKPSTIRFIINDVTYLISDDDISKKNVESYCILQ